MSLERKSNWICWPILETPPPPLPPEAEANQAARAAYEESAEVMAYRQNRREYPATVREDTIVSAEQVEPGKYRLVVLVGAAGDSSTPGGVPVFKPVLAGSVDLAVPSDPPSGTIDAGVIQLGLVPARP